MYQTVHGAAACEAVLCPVPGPPQAQGVLDLLFFGFDAALYSPRAPRVRVIT